MDWVVLLPPVVAIVLALWTRQVYLSLAFGLFIGTTILKGGNPILGLREFADQIVAVFLDAGNAKIILFSLLVGGLIALVQASGGVQGFIGWMQRMGVGKTRRSAEVLACVAGALVFVESNISALVVGTLSRPFFDKLNMPREKLAYYCDATSGPICMALPLNGWGAYVLGLLAAQGIVTGAVGLFASALLFNFYTLFIILFTFFLAFTGWRYGSMKAAEERAATTGQVSRIGAVPMMADEVADIKPVREGQGQARDMLVPILVMIVMIFLSLYITGEGDFMKGSGSTAVFWAVGAAILVAMVMYAIPRPLRGGKPVMTTVESTEWVLKGASGLVAVVVLVVFAFALGQVSRELEMGPYIVGLISEDIPSWWLPGLVFVVGCFISFTLGSSWTTFAILMPIALPLAEGLGISMPLMLGAVLSSGLFGDHASPLSDTTIMASMASACDHVDHVNTQLPYALIVAGVSFVAFLVAGLVM